MWICEDINIKKPYILLIFIIVHIYKFMQYFYLERKSVKEIYRKKILFIQSNKYRVIRDR